jgi:hypothetical protein
MYIPVTDYSVLPKQIEAIMVYRVLQKIRSGKKVAIFCIGGHGRTGYFTSLLLGKLGIEDPIKYIRDNYCESAVETNSQVSAIAKFLGHPEWEGIYHTIGYSKSYYDWGNYRGYDYDDYSYYNNYNKYNKESSTKQSIGFKMEEKKEETNAGCPVYCEDCPYFSLSNSKNGSGHCYKYDSTANSYDTCLEDE